MAKTTPRKRSVKRKREPFQPRRAPARRKANRTPENEFAERKRAEEALRANEGRMRLIVDTALDAVIVMDGAGRVIGWNPIAESTFGWSREEAVGQVLAGLIIPPRYREAHTQGLQRFLATGEGPVLNRRIEITALRRDGSEFPVELTITPLRAGEQVTFSAFVRDITERKRAEAALRESEERFKAFMDNSPALSWMKNAAGQYCYSNKAHSTFFKFVKETTIGKYDADFMPADVARELRANDQKVLATGQTLETAETVPDAEGHAHDFLIVKFPVRDSSGEGFVGGFAIDITERKRAEEAVREERTFTDALLESLPGVVYLYDTSGRFLKWNKNFERVTGYTSDEIARMHPLDFFSGQDKELVSERIQRVFQRGVADVEADFVAKDGTRTPYYFTGLATQVKGTQCVVGMGIDITERKQLEESRLAQLAADRANQAKSEFLSRMSHELRTPLNAVLGYAQMLEMDSLSPKQTQRVQHILKGGRHLLALINEVLDITRIEAGRMTLSLEPVLVATVIAEAADLVRPQAAARKIQLVIPVAKGEPLYVFAEQQRLKQVLLNLLSNGVKYNRESGTLTVSEQIVPGNRYRLTVTDTGGGIPPKLLSRLFTPFDRLEADSRTEGTGLGLVLSRSLMTAMGGTLSVESEVSRGTSFTLDLPLSGPPVARAAPVPSGKVAVSVPLSGKTVTVLYIEDNQSNYQLVEELVEKRPDVKLIGAMQGQLGVELAVAHRPDLILLDLNLPDIQGDEVLQRLRERTETAAIPVVMLSADALQKQVDKLLAAGAQAYLTKPIEVEKFYALLDDLMARKGG